MNLEQHSMGPHGIILIMMRNVSYIVIKIDGSDC